MTVRDLFGSAIQAHDASLVGRSLSHAVVDSQRTIDGHIVAYLNLLVAIGPLAVAHIEHAEGLEVLSLIVGISTIG